MGAPACKPTFVYDGETVQGCTVKNNGGKGGWCSHDPEYAGAWSPCISCDEPPSTACHDGWIVAPLCKTPFLYDGQTLEGCTTKNNGAAGWCSHDVEYAGHWSKCAPCASA